MSKVEVTQQNLNEAKEAEDKERVVLEGGDTQNEVNDIGVMKIILEDDPNIFLLNNLLMSFQFFENYERDVEILRENWFKELPLESHHKKCFYADSLFRLSKGNVKFIPRHGKNKNLEASLHPFRVYISSDNIEAAYDPSVLGYKKTNIWPQYQFTVRTNETIEKFGYISLIEFKTIEEPIDNPKAKTPRVHFVFNDAADSEKTGDRISHYQKKSVIEEKYNRILTKTEKQNKKERRSSLKYFTHLIIENNGYYKFTNPEARLTPVLIRDFRMNSSLATSHAIPRECFQREETKKKFNSRRTALNECFKTQNVLNSAAFKGYFCDLLINKLSESINLDSNAVNESSVLEEFIIVKQKEAQYCFTPVIAIRDWNDYVSINKRFQENQTKQVAWPSDQMQKIMNILPCHAVPTGYFNKTEENIDYEKTWKLVFPKAEEFLILHMMHAHIRCYFFALLLYKSFIETEINSASFGPKHLMHLLFWRVHKNFLAWPEDRPGETLLNYLKVLYKKLQNKFLSDFFITSRNLFADSLPKDLHKAQFLIKKIIENPVPYFLKAFRNLQSDINFYPSFDVVKLNTVINTPNIVEKLKKNKKQKKPKAVTFQEDEEQRLKKIAMKQIQLEKKAEEEQQTRKGSIESIIVDEFLGFNTQDLDKCNQILEMFTSHFAEMGNKSLKYNFLSQAFFYLNQSQKLFHLSMDKGMEEKKLKVLKQKITELKVACYGKLKQDLKKSLPTEKPVQTTTKNTVKSFKTMEKNEIGNIKESIRQKIYEKQREKVKMDEETADENEVFSVKL